MNIVAITVTYNDAEYLRKCVDGLINQTFPLYKIIIVDNNSNAQNREIINTLESDVVEVLALKENFGGAGGFQRGMEYALNKYDPDWYWLMDADAYPMNDCLEKLLGHKDDREDIGYLAPLIYGVDLKQYQLYHHKTTTKFLERDISLYSSYNEIPGSSEIVTNAFVGPLFSKVAIQSCGVPDGNLFIYGDDMEFTYRVTRKFNALLIKEAIINHRDQPAANGVQQPKNWWKDYYMYRNRLLFIDKYQNKGLNREIGHFLVWLRILKQRAICIKTINNKELKKIRLSLLSKAYNDGISGIHGKSIDPKDFLAMIGERA